MTNSTPEQTKKQVRVNFNPAGTPVRILQMITHELLDNITNYTLLFLLLLTGMFVSLADLGEYLLRER